MKLSGYLGWLVLAVVAVMVIVADQIAKYFILQSVEYGAHIPVLSGFFALTLTFNRGAAFGLFSGIEDPLVRYIILGTTSLLALVGVVYVVVRDYKTRPSAFFALGAIVGGAIGNFIDRIRFGGVVDFLDVYWEEYHWPAFNVADSFICVGVGVLLLLSITCTPHTRT